MISEEVDEPCSDEHTSDESQEDSEENENEYTGSSKDDLRENEEEKGLDDESSEPSDDTNDGGKTGDGERMELIHQNISFDQLQQWLG